MLIFVENPGLINESRIRLPEYNLSYREVEEGIVRACADILPIDKEGNLLLARRSEKVKLIAGKYWVFGGRLGAFQLPLQAAHEYANSDLSLAIPVDRFHYVECYQLLWGPEVLRHDNTCWYYVKLSDEEIAGIKLSDEYVNSSLRKFSLDEAVNSRIHPAIVNAFQKILGVPITISDAPYHVCSQQDFN